MSKNAASIRVVLVMSVLILATGAFAPKAAALIQVVDGNAPVTDAGWPQSAVAVANLPTRTGYVVGPPFGTGSQYIFSYQCRTTEEFNQALSVFSSILTPCRELVIWDGSK